MVPTLTEEERILLQNLRIGVDPVPKSIAIKAKRHAMERIKAGLNPFLPAEPQKMNLGGSVSTMMGRTPEPSLPKLSEAQIANLSASFAPGAATTDIFGEFPEFPASNVSVKEMLGGQRAPSLAENIKEGEYLSAGLQGLGGIGDLAYAIPLAGPAIASVLKAPRALQKVLELSRRVEDASDIFGEGAKRVRLTDKETGGTIELLERPDGSASVIELQVPEEFRGQGVGEALQAKALAEYPNMQGQVSSKAAATTAYRLGRRPYGNPDATLDDVFAQIDEMSSVNLISPDRQLALDPNAFKGTDRLAKAQKAGFDTDTVYYHGADADITEFRMPSRETGQTKTVGTGVFMSSSPEVASSYAKSLDDAAVYPVYINKQDFLKVRPAEKGNFWSRIPTDGLVVEFPDGTTKPATDVFKLEPGETDTDELSRIARSQGRKGLIVEGVVDAGVGGAGEYRYATQYLRDKGYDVSLPIGTTKESFDKMNAVPPEIMKEARLYAKAQLYRPADVVVSFDPKNIRSVNAKFEDLDTADISKAKGGSIDIKDIDIFES
jgi:predicted GNAT family acetyltransferase